MFWFLIFKKCFILTLNKVYILHFQEVLMFLSQFEICLIVLFLSSLLKTFSFKKFVSILLFCFFCLLFWYCCHYVLLILLIFTYRQSSEGTTEHFVWLQKRNWIQRKTNKTIKQSKRNNMKKILTIVQPYSPDGFSTRLTSQYPHRRGWWRNGRA